MDMAATFHETEGSSFPPQPTAGRRCTTPSTDSSCVPLSLRRVPGISPCCATDFPLVLVAGSRRGRHGPLALRDRRRGAAGSGPRAASRASGCAKRTRARTGNPCTRHRRDTALLEELWTAAERVSAVDEENAEEVLRYTAAALKLDGEVVGCDGVMPAKSLAHLWEAAHATKARAFRQAVDTLVVRLSDILRAAFIHSAAGQQPGALRASVGVRTSTCSTSTPCRGSSAAARPRTNCLRHAAGHPGCAGGPARNQRVFADPKASPLVGCDRAVRFQFGDSASAVEAFRARLPALVETVRVMAVAELEADGRCVEADHDLFGASAIGRSRLTTSALFPDYSSAFDPIATLARECQPDRDAVVRTAGQGSGRDA